MTENIHTPEIPASVASFNEYRALSDHLSNAYRKVGILSDEKYKLSVADSRTTFIQRENGISYPAIVHSDHIDGYDVERCKKLTGKQDVHLLTIPVEFLLERDQKGGLDFDKDVALLVESDTPVTEKAKAQLTSLFNGQWVAHDFVDERIDDEDHKKAWIGIYGAKTEITNRYGQTEKRSLEDVFAADYGDLHPVDGHALYTGDQLKSDKELLDKIWDIFDDRFEWLGEGHPLSMQDTRETFEAIIFSPNTYITIRFLGDEPVCAGLFTHDVENSEWISDNTLKSLQTTSENSALTLMYFHGIAAKLTDVGRFSEGLIKFHAELAAKTGIDYLVTFESSNISSMYIPRIVADYMNQSGSMKVEPFAIMARQDYWYFTKNQPESY